MAISTDGPAAAADPAVTPREERVVLLDPAGRPAGTAPKATVHGPRTPLHLAFSCYVLAPDDQVLVTRRALGKATWPGVWTNAVCGHPGPGEAVTDAVVRRGGEELGLRLGAPVSLLPDFAYRAVDASGTVENEVCPVFAARTDTDPRPRPEEVCEWAWTPWPVLRRLAVDTPWLLSPWAVLQVRELAERGVHPAEVVGG